MAFSTHLYGNPEVRYAVQLFVTLWALSFARQRLGGCLFRGVSVDQIVRNSNHLGQLIDLFVITPHTTTIATLVYDRVANIELNHGKVTGRTISSTTSTLLEFQISGLFGKSKSFHQTGFSTQIGVSSVIARVVVVVVITTEYVTAE